MSDDGDCNCDYSYVCGPCQDRINALNMADYINEVRDWTVDSIKTIAEKVGVDLPKAPEKRDN